MKSKTIILISPEPWSHIHVSKHHYAILLSKQGNKVFFLNPPSKKTEVKSTRYENLLEVNYTGFVKGLRFVPPFVQRFLMKVKFNKIQQIVSKQIDVVWSFDNSVFFDFEALPKGVLKISHIVDLNQDFQFNRAAKTANICFGTTQMIVDKLKLQNPNSFFIHHGLQEVIEPKGNSEVQLPGSQVLKALYLGNLAMKYLDWEILLEGALKNPEIDFVFIGSNKEVFDTAINPMHTFKRQMDELPNVFFCNQIPSDMIFHYISAANLLLIAYQENHHQDQANPHKMMEYLASGKPIVCTHTSEYSSLKDCVAMSENNGEWSGVLADVCKHISYWSSEELLNKRKSYALEHTYERQLERIKGYIEKI